MCSLQSVIDENTEQNSLFLQGQLISNATGKKRTNERQSLIADLSNQLSKMVLLHRYQITR